MRILFCSDQYDLVGGAEVYLLDSIKCLEDMGHEVGVLHDAPAGNGLGGMRQSFRIPGSMGFIHDKSTSVVRAVEDALRRFSPDVIYAIQCFNPATLHVLPTVAPTIRYVMGLELTCPAGRRLPRTWDGICTKPFDIHCLWKAHTQLCMPRRPDTALRVWNDVRKKQRANARFHRILVPSRYIQRLLTESGMDPAQLEVLYLYAHLGAAAEANKPSGERCIVALGRPSPEKGYEYLIEALQFIEEPTTLRICGDSPYLEELHRFAARAPSRHTIEFPGWIGREEITSIYTQARVAAVPSVWPEPFGIVGIEAMAHGLPVVAFDVGGISDWLEGGTTGELVPRKDIPALALALDRYLSDNEMACRHGEAGREKVRGHFLAERHFSRLIEVLEEAAAS